MKELKTEPVLEYIRKQRTGEILLTAWTEEDPETNSAVSASGQKIYL
jgi:hypothetical protein